MSLSTRINIALAALLIALIGGVYVAKGRAKAEHAQMLAVEAEVIEARRAVRVLRAEVAHLEDPARLERLARKHLGLVRPKPQAVIAYEVAARRHFGAPLPTAPRRATPPVRAAAYEIGPVSEVE